MGTELRGHGTIAVDRDLDVFTRLRYIYYRYLETIVNGSVDEMHIEQLPRRCHHYTHWSVGVIGSAGAVREATVVAADIPVQSWQKACDWKGKRVQLKKSLLHPVSSEDEEAAVGMGLYYVNK